MGARRPASGKNNVHTLKKGSQTAVITRLSVSLCFDSRRGTRLLKNARRGTRRPPLVLAFGACVWCLCS